jgi:N4-gp56 family major capsid protein
MTGTTQLDDRLIKVYSDVFIITAREGLDRGLDSTVDVKEEINAKSISMTKYAKHTPTTTALTEDEDVTSTAMSDSEIELTPAEYGDAVTETKLVRVQSGGQSGLAAFEVEAIHARESQEKLLIETAEASTNVIYPGSITAEANVTATDIMNALLVRRAMNKLVRAGIRGPYWAVAHDDVIHDLRSETAAGGWLDVNKYQNSQEIRDNEVGMFGGFRWISHPQVTINTDAGSGTVDTYHTLFYGFNALGKAVSVAVDGVVSGPFDKLGRFVNIGWYGIYTYGIIDSAALWVATTASSLGSN